MATEKSKITIWGKIMKKDSNQKNKRSEIDLVPLLKEYLKKAWLMVLVGVIVGGMALCATKLFVKPTYRCRFSAYINNKQSKQSSEALNYSDLSASKELVKTYSQILKSNTILTAAAKEIDLDKPYSQLKNMVTTEIQDATEIITSYVVHTDPGTAYSYAEAISKTAPEYMMNMVEGSSMKIIDYPEYNDKRYKPSYLLYTLIGFLIGVLGMGVYVTISYFRDDTVKDESEVENKFAIPILGVIPDVNTAGGKRSDQYYYSYYASDEASPDKNKNNAGESEQKDDEKQK